MADATPRPTVSTRLRWQGGLRFEAGAGPGLILLDGDGEAGASPVLALVCALAACMGMDVVHVLRKAQLPLEGLEVDVHGERAAEDPRRLLKVDLRFEVRGAVPGARVQRAIDLSRAKYCSVWHSLARDVDLTTSVVLQG